jgi:hypothetical protein
MPQFMFFLRDKMKEWGDEEAVEFPGIADAEQHAREVAAELAHNESPSALQDRFIVVKSPDGTEVARIPLGETRLQ